jgi:hypothetical protein
LQAWLQHGKHHSLLHLSLWLIWLWPSDVLAAAPAAAAGVVVADCVMA